MARLSFALLAATVLPSIMASSVMVLDSKNFTDYIGKGVPALVEFYAPWCGHCKNLAPTYDKLAEVFGYARDRVYIAKVDADGPGREVGTKNGVTGFPTLKWFDGSSPESSEKYEGGRELEDFAKFIQSKTGVAAKIKAPPPSPVVLLDTDNFERIVMDETKDVYVAFTAPWCGHCKALKPVWEKVAGWVKPESNVVVALIDADAPQNKHIGNLYEINSYPTILHFPAGSKDKSPQKYDGYNWELNLLTYINEHSGTFRDIGGYLNDKAGRIPSLDTLATELFEAVPTSRAALYEDAKKAAEALGASGAYYLRVMQKVVDGGEEWVAKETKRLTGIFEKRQAPLAKLDEVKAKLNVLSAFAKKKAEEAADAAASVKKDEL